MILLYTTLRDYTKLGLTNGGVEGFANKLGHYYTTLRDNTKKGLTNGGIEGFANKLAYYSTTLSEIIQRKD